MKEAKDKGARITLGITYLYGWAVEAKIIVANDEMIEVLNRFKN